MIRCTIKRPRRVQFHPSYSAWLLLVVATAFRVGVLTSCTGIVVVVEAFSQPQHTPHTAATPSSPPCSFVKRRRDVFQEVTSTSAAILAALATNSWFIFHSPAVLAAEFTPGGTLVDRPVGVRVGNPEASASRQINNANVLFDKDYYFKFGVAAPWIAPDSTEFPKTMPFTVSQQRYDSLKKYGDRVKASVARMKSLKRAIINGDDTFVGSSVIGQDPSSDPSSMLRPMGLMANGFLASENTGSTNELYLARWYVNEMYLRLLDIRNATSKEEALEAHKALVKACDSYLTMMNRVITPKIGEKFEYLSSSS